MLETWKSFGEPYQLNAAQELRALNIQGYKANFTVHSPYTMKILMFQTC